MWQLVVYVLAFVLLAGLLAMIEAAVLSISPAEVEELFARRDWGSRPLKVLKEQITRPMVVLVLLINTLYILGPILAGNQAIELFGNAAIPIVTVLLTVATIVFSEIIPKSLGTHYAPWIARLSAPLVHAAIYLLYPAVIALERLANLFKSGTRRIGTEEQIRSLAAIGRHAGYIDPQEGRLVRRAFVLNDRTADEIMTSREAMVTIAADANIGEAAAEVLRHEFSRCPVIGQTIDDVKGMVTTRDLLQGLAEERDGEPISPLVRPCLLLSPETTSDDLLLRFRDDRVHLAVVQRARKTIGLVTLEDVLEELVGEIEDEKSTD
jgi:CBS domain containing-hemolysin-like protein